MRLKLNALIVLLFVLLFSGITKAQNSSSSIFWVDEDKQEIGFTNLSTNTNTTLVKGPGDLNYINTVEIDSISGDVFFVTPEALKRGFPEDNSAETLHTFGGLSTQFNQLVLDTETDALFLSNGEQQVIYKYDLQTEVMDSILTRQDFAGNPWGVGTHNNAVYWTASGSLFKADQDGNNVQILGEDIGNALEIEIDHKNERLYWRDQVNDVIKSLKLDGTGEITVVQTDTYPPMAFTLDQRNDYVYWLRYNGILVQSALDGTTTTDTTNIDSSGGFTNIKNLEYHPIEDAFYWINGNSAIEKQLLEDTVTTKVFEEYSPASIGFDENDEKLFWLDINRKVLATYDYSTHMDTVLTEIPGFLNNLNQMEVDTISNQIFVGGSNIYNIDYAGNILDTLTVNQAGTISGITTDPSNQIIYFTDNGSGSYGNLKKVNYDGTGLETMVEYGLNYSRGIEFDPQNNTLYWASGFNTDSMKIKRMDLVSGSIEVVLNAQVHGLLSPLGIALDPQNEHIYWSDSEKKSIERADYDGENILTILEGEFGVPRDIDVFVSSIITSTENPSTKPSEISLAQNYPNPFNPRTNISFRLNSVQTVSLTVFNMLGRKVQKIINNRTYAAGNHSIQFDASTLSSGVYIYQLEASGKVLTKKLTLIK
ncbi:MAG: T9SS type A sorting domain-containing protein [Gracilimonas sp.]|nr:T9SS type A sorting domain-containing protein [Gracilimonas sp.]